MATVTQNIVDELRSDILAGKYNARARVLSEAQIMRMRSLVETGSSSPRL